MKLVLILDESGSMTIQHDEVVQGVNDFLVEQQKIHHEAKFTLITFNTVVRTVLDDISVHEVRELTRDDYNPDGLTALYDAIGFAITKFQQEDDVRMIIATDGRENCSLDYSKQQIVSMITKCVEKGWRFIYLCEGEDAVLNGQEMGMGNTPGTDMFATPMFSLGTSLSQVTLDLHKRRRMDDSSV
jgi:Mg-chelatase subunit ChlD